MPTASITLDPEILTTTVTPVADEIRDGFHVKDGFLDFQDQFLGKGMPKKNGGKTWVQGIEVAEHADGTNMSGAGDAKKDLTYNGILDDAQFTFDHCVYPVVITAEEEEANGGDGQIIDLAETRTRNMMTKARRRLGLAIAQGGVTELTNIVPMDGNAVTGGLFEDAAFLAQTGTVGGLARASYPTVPVVHHQHHDASNNFNANGWTGLTRMAVAIDDYTMGETKIGILVSRRGLENLKTAIRGYERFGVADVLDPGRMDLAWGGLPIKVWSHLPGAGQSSGAITALMLDFACIHFMWSRGKRDGYLGFEGFQNVSGEYDGMTATVRVRGQTNFKGFHTSGVLWNGETF